MSQSVEAEYLDIVNRNAWTMVYQGIRETCDKYKYSFIEAKRPHNIALNRYMDVNPFDHSRVVLKRGTQDYINANTVKIDKANRKYILTQGPLPSTVGHFWLMVWEQNCKIILMLNKVIEKDLIKCHWYWPSDTGSEGVLTFSEIGLQVQQISTEEHPHFVRRLFKLTDEDSKTSREVIQFQYTTWPDFGVPSSPNDFLEFLQKVQASGGLDPSLGPPVVHCSAGIGRSGTFCLIDSCLVLIQKYGIDNVTVRDILLEMRKDRMGLIQTPDQLRFSYQAIIEGAKRLNPDYIISNTDNIVEEVAVEDDGPPPLPPPRAESLRPPASLPSRPLPAIPTSESLGDLVENRTNHTVQLPITKSENITNGVKGSHGDSKSETNFNEKLAPPTRELPEAPSDSDEDMSEVSGETAQLIEKKEISSGARKRAFVQSSLREHIQEIKKRQQEAERLNNIKRSLYTPVAITFGILVCGALAYMYIKN